MTKPTFLTYEKPLLTCMVQANNPDRVAQLVKASLPEGAEAIGMQFCRMKREYRNKETYLKLFALAEHLPIYVTNYRDGENRGKSDEVIASELVELAECGATLCDVMGDLYDVCDCQLIMNEEAIKKQMKLIDELHSKGAEVIISSHVMKFTPAERVLEMALEQQRRGADIAKIVSGAGSMEQQIENLRIVNLLKENLKIPFVFLSAGESRILRCIGGALGCCMYLCVYEHDELSTKTQPLLRDVKSIRDSL